MSTPFLPNPPPHSPHIRPHIRPRNPTLYHTSPRKPHTQNSGNPGKRIPAIIIIFKFAWENVSMGN